MEKGIKYPLGNDQFEIDHGPEYFKFFERLGEIYFSVVVDENSSKIAAVVCGVLRNFPAKKKQKLRAWYFCNLKGKSAFKIFIHSQTAINH